MPAKTIAFFGATTGVGLSCLKHALATGHRCVALCRNPARLAELLPPEANPSLRIVRGNGRNVDDIMECLRLPVSTDGGAPTGNSDGVRVVDQVISTIGSRFGLTGLEDPEVCRVFMTALTDALARLRREPGFDATCGADSSGRPHITACSTTGLSRFGRDVPLAFLPFYHVLLRGAHEDKRAMEDRLVASGERFTVVRCSLLVDGATDRTIRAGVEDPTAGRRESTEIGYTISREDAGRWFAENLVDAAVDDAARYHGKIVSITY